MTRAGTQTRAGTRPRIVQFRWWHIEQVLPIEADLFGAEQWSAEMFWNELANDHHYLAAVDDADEVAGYAGLAWAGDPGAPDEAWVQNIAVRRDAQRRGLGRTLLTALLDEAGRRGAGRTFLEVAVDNAPAQRLYAAYGFEPVGVRRGYYQPSNTDALVMMRDG
ncbi:MULTISPECIES: ribosomal protein S18-alanine N-acetyltransferase [unclassified Solwaraspora]|uniref:ribosomal protein S18-alanine N-acetyltransferase n=1 Tax=unclassified Solwaraspora TaxID=2627926 RepID=UPI00259BA0EE|nr:ribosomal protein S18-alanine N-acetyltransferase [Solwaraspora sp. WMMA2056]WJK42347.1 ribosomal protein S18-alanine N-acetyltransferase [Solwaraspora sp. WMMA2056]